VGAGCGHLPVQPVEVPAHRTAKTWARFTAKIVPTPGCHFWAGALADDGDGQFTANGGTVRAWRFLWPAHHGPLPPQEVVLHQSCDQPSCTRLDHLRAGSQAENLASAASRDRTEAVAAHRPRGPACRWPDGPGPSGPPGPPATTRNACRQRRTPVTPGRTTLGRTGQCCSDRVGRGPQLAVPVPPAWGEGVSRR